MALVKTAYFFLQRKEKRYISFSFSLIMFEKCFLTLCKVAFFLLVKLQQCRKKCFWQLKYRIKGTYKATTKLLFSEMASKLHVFFISNAFYSTQSQCCLSFYNHYYNKTHFKFRIFVSMFRPSSICVVSM